VSDGTRTRDRLDHNRDPDGPSLQALRQEFDSFMRKDDRRGCLWTDRKRIGHEVDREIARRLEMDTI
jgi:hypothetical protein